MQEPKNPQKLDAAVTFIAKICSVFSVNTVQVDIK